MGTYLNPRKYAYEEAVRTVVFVDKTPMIRYLNSLVRTKEKYVCVSRPHRFGKTVAVDMLSAYYGRDANSNGGRVARADEEDMPEARQPTTTGRRAIRPFMREVGSSRLRCHPRPRGKSPASGGAPPRVFALVHSRRSPGVHECKNSTSKVVKSQLAWVSVRMFMQTCAPVSLNWIHICAKRVHACRKRPRP